MALIISLVLSTSCAISPAPVDTQPIETTEQVQTIETTIETEAPTLSAEELLWLARAEEYPIATQVWLYMKDTFGWSDIVCAGVMGNIMGEISGGTLDFSDWNCSTPYGMFQWLGQRKVDIKAKYGEEPSIFEQLDFMYDELYGTNGVRQQVTDYQREKILNASNEKDVATYFCIYFERPGHSGNERRRYATIAYEYFAN